MEGTPPPPGEGPIWTPDRRVRVFLSSTLTELAPERAAARKAVEDMHLTPVLFELGARPHPPRALYAAYLGQSDVFIGIYWQRYGWVAPGATVSGIEDEYELSASLPRLLYVKEPAPDRDGALAQLLVRFATDARASYRRFTDTDELGRLVADDLAVLLSERFATTASHGPPRSQSTIPVPLTPTIGRTTEIATVVELLRRGIRLVTITGTGGVGKSRLAVTVAQELTASGHGEVHFVQLSSLSNPEHLMATIAEHVGARLEAKTAVDAIADRVRDRRVLLVLDNFEHLTAAATEVTSLLDRCPGAQVLVTSRHLLRLRGENEFALAPLDLPDPGAPNVAESSAVQLFVDRATAARPDFALTSRNEQSVAELCRRLDGLPLALELAAARLRLLEPDQLLERIGTRIDLLAGGAADLPERQRALHATLEWSYNLLTPSEQTLFARLSVFVGGATLVAAEAVCGDAEVGDVLDVMASLLEKSLLVHLTTVASPIRFQMLHVVRAYAWERLAERGQTDLLRRRHAQWFLEIVASRDISASGDERWQRFDAEVDNIRSVQSWALEQRDVGALATLARELRSWWWVRGMTSEAIEWLERAAATAAELAPDTVEAAWTALALGHLEQLVGRSDDAERRLLVALALFASHDEAEGVMTARLALASALADGGRTTEAITNAYEALEQARAAGRDEVISWASGLVGTFLAAQGELGNARTAYEESRDAAARMGSDVYVARAHHELAIVELFAGRQDVCWRELGLAAAIYRHTPHLAGISGALEIAAAACLADDDVERAADAITLARQLCETFRLPTWPVARLLHDRLTADLSAVIAGDEQARTVAVSDPAAFLERLCERHLVVAE